MNKLTTLTAAVSLATLYALPAMAADGTWSEDSGSGVWSDPTRWSGSIAGGPGSTASFEVPSVSGDYDITLDSSVTLAELRQLGNGWNSMYRITGPGTLNFDTDGGGAARIALSSTETTGSFLQSFTIESAVTGSTGLTISGSGRRQYVVWDPVTMGLTGGITLQSAGLQVASGTALGNNTITMTGSGLSFLGFSSDGGTYAQSIILDSATTSLMNFVPHGSVSTDPPTHYVSGQISESAGGSKGIYYSTSTNTAGGTRFVVSGNNSYKGSTTISASQIAGVNMNSGPIVVRATHNNAFGSGTNAVIQILSASSGIELEGGITISGKTARLNGEGFRGQGSMNSVSGDNQWSGNIVLRYGTDRGTAPTIGVESDTLTVTGTISDGNTSDGLHKVGEGTLILAQANTYATGTVITEGSVVADHNTALGSGEVTLDGGSLVIAEGRTIGNSIAFGAAGGVIGGTGTLSTTLGLSSLEHKLAPGGGTLEIAGDQSWSAFSYVWSFDGEELASGYDQIVVGGVLDFNTSGEYELDATILGNDWLQELAQEESYSWTILSATELTGFDASNWTLRGLNAQWTLRQEGEAVILSYQAVPEPTSIALVALGGVFGYGLFRGRRKSVGKVGRFASGN